MESIGVTEFKARCLEVLEEVRQSGRAVTVTRSGKAVARIEPPAVRAKKRKLGAMRGTATIVGDIVGPISTEADWFPERP